MASLLLSPLYRSLGLVCSLGLISCVTTKTQETTDPVKPAVEKAAVEDPRLLELPEELRDAHKYDPAATLDTATVQESDFFQIRKSVDENKAALDSAWREQEQLENRVKSAKTIEEQRRAAEAKRQEEELERKRQQEVAEFEKNKSKRAKEAQDAEDAMKKLPTISKDEIMWQGLED
jgi:hypothetical protein